MLKAVRPTLMAELTALSVACPAAAPYLHRRSDWARSQSKRRETEDWGELIIMQEDCKDGSMLSVNYPMHNFKLILS